MNSMLLKNGMKFCAAGEPLSIPTAGSSFVILTDKRVVQLPGDIFEFANLDVRFRVNVGRCIQAGEGWETTCTYET